MRARIWITAVAVVIGAVIAGGWIAAIGDGEPPAQTSGTVGPYVGGDLHVLTVLQDRLYVGGHDGGAVSADGGTTWTQLPSLDGADPMGAAATSGETLIGGHPGLYRSSDGDTFSRVTGQGDLGDVHALGGAGDTVYAGTPERGLLASGDGGTTWTTRNAQAGRTFMGIILVDPHDPRRLIAPDMSTGLVTSPDGGITWTALGGPSGAMSAAWDPTDTRTLVAVGMAGSAMSGDGGQTWTILAVPEGTSAATFSSDGKTLYAAALSGNNAAVYASTDRGRAWKPLTPVDAQTPGKP